MSRFLIEVPHDATPDACVKAAEVFLRTVGLNAFTLEQTEELRRRDGG